MKDSSITITKALGIIMMVMGHCGVPYLTKFIYMFHMPLFFILSGYCFKEKYLTDFKVFFLRRVKGLYLPFVKYGLLFLILHNFFFHLNIYNDLYGWNGNVSHLYSLKEIVISAVFGTILFTSSEQLLGGYWFLAQLFWASIFGWVILRFVKNPFHGIIITLSVSCAFKWWNFTVPYTCINGLSFMSTAFFCIGYAICRYNIKSTRWFGGVCLIAVYIGQFFWRSELPSCTIEKMIPYSLTAVLGTLMIMQLSRAISISEFGNLKKFLIFTGTHTLEILTWHFLCFKIVNLIIIFVENKPIEYLAMFPGISNPNINIWWLFYTIFGVGVPLLGVWLTQQIVSKVNKAE